MSDKAVRAVARLLWVAMAVAVGGAEPALALGEKARAEVKGRDGRDLGRIVLIETTAGVLLKMQLRALPPGKHAIHIHETGKCEGDFSSAGEIYNPLQAKHGFLNDEGPAVGDLPNIYATAAGDVEAELFSPFVTLAKDAQESLFDADGAAIVIKEKPDDYRTEPAGGSGERIGCGVIQLAK